MSGLWDQADVDARVEGRDIERNEQEYSSGPFASTAVTSVNKHFGAGLAGAKC